MKYLLILFAAFQCTMVFGQRRWKPDKEYNHPKAAQFVNDTFVKDIRVAVEMTSTPGDGTRVNKQDLETPLAINGVEYNSKQTLSNNKEYEFMTLDEIRRQYCPEAKEPVIYMINEHVIMADEASYKIDKGNIESCAALPSSDFEKFKSKPMITIVHVFTKDVDKPIRLGY